MFEKPRLGLLNIAKFTCLWLQGHIDDTIRQEAGIMFSSNALIGWKRKLREIIYRKMITNFHAIGGPGMIVEIDETKVGKRKYNRGHRVEGQWVFGGICRETGDVFMIPVPDRTRATLKPLIEQ